MKFIRVPSGTVFNDLWIDKIDVERCVVYMNGEPTEMTKEDILVLQKSISYDLNDISSLVSREFERRQTGRKFI